MSTTTEPIQHLRAKHATGVRRLEPNVTEGLPVLIRTQGLLQALALSRGEGYETVQRIVDWLLSDWPHSPMRDVGGRRDRSTRELVAAYTPLSAMEAAAVEREAIAYASTLKTIVKLRSEGNDGSS